MNPLDLVEGDVVVVAVVDLGRLVEACPAMLAATARVTPLCRYSVMLVPQSVSLPYRHE